MVSGISKKSYQDDTVRECLEKTPSTPRWEFFVVGKRYLLILDIGVYTITKKKENLKLPCFFPELLNSYLNERDPFEGFSLLTWILVKIVKDRKTRVYSSI